MKNMNFCIVIALIIALLLVGCGNAVDKNDIDKDNNVADAVEAADKEIPDFETDKGQESSMSYQDILSAEHMSVEEAYEKLKNNPANDQEEQSLVEKLKNLKECSGKFANKTERGNIYSADVSFYLSHGEVYGAVSYTGYMGEIKDGPVKETEEKGYLFMSEPKGDLYGNEQDFHLYFAKDKLHIMWADTCDYYLDRGDGSAESVEDYDVPFDQTDTFQKIVSLIDEKFPDLDHDVVYDAETRELNLYFQAPDNMRAALNTKDKKLMDSWTSLVESMKTFSDDLLKVVEIGGKAYYVNIYWVEKLNSKNDYTEDDYILWVRNGIVKYNAANDSASGIKEQSDSSRKDSAGSTDAAGSSAVSGNKGGGSDHAQTAGERNALETALQYLNYTAFSYSGLIEQLEYEGYSHSESVYAADNCGADWNQQAVKMAKQYLEYTSFSRSGLVEQLEYEGFTHEQAEYAVSVVY